MAHKVHLRQGKNGTTACASARVDNAGNIVPNGRKTYRRMTAEAVLPEDFRALPISARCSHCCDRFTPMMNARRAKNGKPLYKNAMTKELA